MEGGKDLTEGKALDIGLGVRTAMHHECDINILEKTGFKHIDLAAKAFFSWRSVNDKLVGTVSEDFFQGMGRSNHGRSLEMMAAAVTKILKCVIFA